MAAKKKKYWLIFYVPEVDPDPVGLEYGPRLCDGGVCEEEEAAKRELDWWKASTDDHYVIVEANLWKKDVDALIDWTDTIHGNL